MKKQVWLRPDQVDLVVSALKYVRVRCCEADTFNSTINIFAKQYTVRRIDDVLALFEQSPTKEK